jgi:hypothetical protein
MYKMAKNVKICKKKILALSEVKPILSHILYVESKNCETDRNGTKTFLRVCETKRNETESLRNGTKRNGKNNNVSQTLVYSVDVF